MLKVNKYLEIILCFGIFHNTEQEVLPGCLQEATMSDVSQVEGISKNQSTQGKY